MTETTEATQPREGGSAGSRLDEAQERWRIEDAAVHLFLLHGYANVHLDHIADAADVSKNSVHRYYGSKPHLVHELLRSRIRALVRRLTRLRVHELTMDDILEALDNALELLLDRPDDGLFILYYFYAPDLDIPSPPEPHPEYELHELLEQAFHRARARRLTDARDLEALWPLFHAVLSYPALMVTPDFLPIMPYEAPATQDRALCKSKLRAVIRDALSGEEGPD